MAETSIARTSIKVTTDATGAKAGLDQFGGQVRRSMDQIAAHTRASANRIGDEVEQSFHKTESKLNKAFNKFAKKEGGFLGFLGSGVAADLGLVGTAASITGVVLASQQLIHLADDWLRGTKEIEAALERSRERLRESAELLAKNGKLAEEWRNALPDPRDRVSSFDAEIDALERERAALQKTLTPFAGMSDREFLAAGLSGGGKQKIEDLKATREALKGIDKQIAETIQRRNRAADPTADPAFVASINAATHALKEQAETWGLTGTEAQRALFKMRGGTDELLAGFDAWAKKLDALRQAEREHLATFERSILGRSTSPFLSMTGDVFRRAEKDRRAAEAERDHLGTFERSTLTRSTNPLLSMIGQVTREAAKKSIGTAIGNNPAALAGTAAEVSARNRDSQRQLSAAEEKQLAEQKKQSALLEQIAGGVKATAQALAGVVGIAPF